MQLKWRDKVEQWQILETLVVGLTYGLNIGLLLCHRVEGSARGLTAAETDINYFWFIDIIIY